VLPAFNVTLVPRSAYLSLEDTQLEVEVCARWADHMHMDIELMSVSLQPFYLSREFPQIFVTLVVEIVRRLQSIAPDA